MSAEVDAAIEELIVEQAPESSKKNQLEEFLEHQDFSEASITKFICSLSEFEYQTQRKKIASTFGFKRDYVESLRSKGRKSTEDPAQGVDVLFDDPEPWPDPVDGAELLSEIESMIRKYLVAPEPSYPMMAVWSVLSYLTKTAAVMPMLCLNSPTRE